MWCWRRLLRVPWTAKRSNQSILKEISPGCSLAGMMLKLKLQYFSHLMRRVDSLEKTHAGRDWGQEEKGMTEDKMAGWHHRLDGHEFGWTLGVGDGQGGLACRDSWGSKELDTTERLIWCIFTTSATWAAGLTKAESWQFVSATTYKNKETSDKYQLKGVSHAQTLPWLDSQSVVNHSFILWRIFPPEKSD